MISNSRIPDRKSRLRSTHPMLLAAVEDKLEDWVSSEGDVPFLHDPLYAVATQMYR